MRGWRFGMGCVKPVRTGIMARGRSYRTYVQPEASDCAAAADMWARAQPGLRGFLEATMASPVSVEGIDLAGFTMLVAQAMPVEPDTLGGWMAKIEGLAKQRIAGGLDQYVQKTGSSICVPIDDSPEASTIDYVQEYAGEGLRFRCTFTRDVREMPRGKHRALALRYTAQWGNIYLDRDDSEIRVPVPDGEGTTIDVRITHAQLKRLLKAARKYKAGGNPTGKRRQELAGETRPYWYQGPWLHLSFAFVTSSQSGSEEYTDDYGRVVRRPIYETTIEAKSWLFLSVAES